MNIDSKVLDWFISGATGSSSIAMAAHLTGRVARRKFHSHPSDGGDLGHCIKLLDAVPELRDRLPTMAEVSPYWAALVARWSQLERSYRDEKADTDKLIRSILDPIAKGDSRVIRLSPRRND